MWQHTALRDAGSIRHFQFWGWKDFHGACKRGHCLLLMTEYATLLYSGWQWSRTLVLGEKAAAAAQVIPFAFQRIKRRQDMTLSFFLISIFLIFVIYKKVSTQKGIQLLEEFRNQLPLFFRGLSHDQGNTLLLFRLTWLAGRTLNLQVKENDW